jgi:hypothetical protein
MWRTHYSLGWICVNPVPDEQIAFLVEENLNPVQFLGVPLEGYPPKGG